MNQTFNSKYAFFRQISRILVFAIINVLFLAVSVFSANSENDSSQTKIAAPLVEATPALVKDINGTATANNSYPQSLTAVGSMVFFTASDITHGAELWKSDGTSAGTAMIKDFVPGVNDSGIRNLTNVNGTLFLRCL